MKFVGNYGKRGRTTSSERKKIYIYIYTVKNLKKFKNLIKIDVSVRDLHQLQSVWSLVDHTKQVCSNKTMNHSWSPELHLMNILCSSKSWALFEIIHHKGIEFIYIYIYIYITNCRQYWKSRMEAKLEKPPQILHMW